MWEHQERKFGDRRRSDTVGPCVVQISVDLWPASLVSASGSGMCEDGFAGDDALYAVCPSIDDNPGIEGWLEGAGSCVYACKAQASARVDVPTAPEVVPGDLRQCARREGLEVRLSREWVRAFLVSIDLSYKSAAQRRGLSTSVPKPNRCCKRSSATFLQPCDVGLMRPFKATNLPTRSIVSGSHFHGVWVRLFSGKLDSGGTL